MSNSPKHPRKAHVDRATQDLIGCQLRTMYSELLAQPLPEKLLSALLAVQDAEEGLVQPEVRLRKAA
jgi:hypothetical protein